MVERPSFDTLDFVAFGSATVILVFAYVVYSTPVTKFGAWATVITIYMIWFCYYGVKWLYDVYM